MSRYRQTFTEAYQQVEKWSKDVEVKSTGEHAGKTIGQLEKEVDALRGKSNNEKEMGGLLFAIRAKQGWKKGEGSTGVKEATQTKHERGEVKTDKAERGERKAGESEDDYEDRESGGKSGLRPNPFAKKKKQDDLDRDNEAQATRSKFSPTAEEHNCDEVHPDVSHKDWIAQKDEALDTWHPDPAQDRKSTSMKHTAKAVAHHDAQKKKPAMDTRQAATKIQDILRKQRERKAAQKESNLPPHLSKFLDKKGNPNPEAAKRMAAGKKKREVAVKVKDVTPKGYGPSEDVEVVEYIKTNGERRKTAGGDGRRTGNHVSITPAGKKALKKGDQKLSITAKGRAAVEDVEIDELSNTTLSSYKTKAAAQASAADKKGNFKKADKRFSGITRATNKQFANDAKKEDMSLAPKGKGRKAAKAMYGVEDIVKGISVSKKMAGTTVPPKQAPASQRMDKSKNLMPAPGWKTRKAGSKAGQMTTEDLEFKVTIKGIPPFYVPAKTAAAVKQSLRKQLKHPDDIQSIIRVTKAAQKIDYRKRAQGKSDEEDKK